MQEGYFILYEVRLTHISSLTFELHDLIFRILYRLYFMCITVMFVFNLSFDRIDPPLDFYAVFIGKNQSFYYIGNFIYQLFLFFDLLLCAAAVESAFVMSTIFVTCRLNFILELFQFIDDEKKSGHDVLGLINFTINIHVDVLRLAMSCKPKYIKQCW